MALPAVTQDERDAYNQTRMRLLDLAQKKPWLLEIAVALSGRRCIDCSKQTVVEYPADNFYCKTCTLRWRTINGVTTKLN